MFEELQPLEVVDSRRPMFSVGYEGEQLGAFVGRLARSGVEIVVDVRLNPLSRKPGFSKTPLAAALGAAGITYVHESTLGNPRDNREAFHDGRLSEGRRLMRERLLDGSGAALARLVALARDHRVAVMCFERDHEACHRQVVTDMAKESAPELEILTLP